MKLCIFALTKGGLKLADRINEVYEGIDIYTLEKWNDGAYTTMEDGFKATVEKVFFDYDGIFFIMATGIVVRTIAPIIKSKLEDPAVLVMDERGQNVISLLSGHIGGGNRLAIELAEKLEANPVITTSSDVNHSLAVDIFALLHDLGIENMLDAKDVTALIVNGFKVGICGMEETGTALKMALPENVEPYVPGRDYDGLIIIEEHGPSRSEDQTLPFVRLKKRRLVIGVGCRKGVEQKRIIEALSGALLEHGRMYCQIKHFATVDVKKEEAGIIDTARYFKVPLRIVGRDEIAKVEDQFHTSEFVRSSIGVGAVAEPCAYLTSEDGGFLMRKKKYGGITIAIWEERHD